MRNKTPGAPGNPYCCFSDCEKDATFEIADTDHPLPGGDDRTHSCDEHLAVMMSAPSFVFTLSRIINGEVASR